jgi:hypothetical protein
VTASLRQLESREVWAAWGLAHLRGRDFEGARDKLKHAFAASTSGATNQNLLQRLLSALESFPTPTMDDISFIQEQMLQLQQKAKGRGKHQDFVAQLRPPNAEDIFAVNAVRLGKVSLESNLDGHRFFEGIYYLKTYGSPEALVRFCIMENQIYRVAKLNLFF